VARKPGRLAVLGVDQKPCAKEYKIDITLMGCGENVAGQVFQSPATHKRLFEAKALAH